MKNAGKMSCILAILVSCCYQRNSAFNEFRNTLLHKRIFGFVFPKLANSLTRSYTNTRSSLKRKRIGAARFWIPSSYYATTPLRVAPPTDEQHDATTILEAENTDGVVEDEREYEDDEGEEYDAESLLQVWDHGDLGNIDRKEGSVTVDNTQRKFPIDKDLLQQQIQDILEVVGFRNYDVSVWITSDDTVRRLNTEYRNKAKSTDILSFPFHEPHRPGRLPKPRHEGEMNLGELIISARYVNRVCEKDKRTWEKKSAHPCMNERGVSGAMAKVFTVQERMPLLAIHGILHLLGYDHETFEDWEEMVEMEEEVLAELQERMNHKYAAAPWPVEQTPLPQSHKSKERVQQESSELLTDDVDTDQIQDDVLLFRSQQKQTNVGFNNQVKEPDSLVAFDENKDINFSLIEGEEEDEVSSMDETKGIKLSLVQGGEKMVEEEDEEEEDGLLYEDYEDGDIYHLLNDDEDFNEEE